MGRIVSTIFGAALLLITLTVSPVAAQQSSTDELKEEIRVLRESVEALQKDIREIKAQLSRQAPRPSGVGAELELGDSPAKGERNATLTLIEFSDYQ